MNDIVPLIALVLAVLVIVLAMRAAFRRMLRSGTRPDRRRGRRGSGTRPDRRRGRRDWGHAPQDVETNPKSILVDGSNVMHWQDNTPRVETLQRVLAKLRNAGNDPILCFDANIGYKLVNQHMDAGELAKFFGVAQRNILICPSGTDADAMILRIAVAKSVPVVSNDKYRDYPDLAARIGRMDGTVDGTQVNLRYHRN